MIRSGRYFAFALLMTTVAMNISGAQVAAKTGSSAKSQSVVVVDMEKLLGPIQKKFEEEREKIGQEFQKSMEASNKKRQELEAKKSEMKEEEYKKQIGELDAKAQNEAQGIQGRMMILQQKASKDAEALIKQVDGIRADNGWDIIVPSGAAIAYNKAIDVTETVTAKLNKAKDTKDTKVKDTAAAKKAKK